MYGTGTFFNKMNCEKILKHNFIFLAPLLLATKTGAYRIGGNAIPTYLWRYSPILSFMQTRHDMLSTVIEFLFLIVL